MDQKRSLGEDDGGSSRVTVDFIPCEGSLYHTYLGKVPNCRYPTRQVKLTGGQDRPITRRASHEGGSKSPVKQGLSAAASHYQWIKNTNQARTGLATRKVRGLSVRRWWRGGTSAPDCGRLRKVVPTPGDCDNYKPW